MAAGLFLAAVACAIFLRGYPRERVPELDRRVAPVLALGALAVVLVGVGCFWVAYRYRMGG